MRFDVGQVVGTVTIGSVTYIQFDRYQAYDEAGDLRSGPELRSEFILGAATDWPFVNDNPKIRAYPLDADVEVITTSETWLRSQPACGDDADATPSDPVYEPATLGDAVGAPAVSLTFDESGVVTRIRIMNGC